MATCIDYCYFAHMKEPTHDVLRLAGWLSSQPSLEELQKRFPEEWAETEKQLEQAIRERDRKGLDRLLRPLHDVEPIASGANARVRRKQLDELGARLVRQRMAAVSIERFMKLALTEGQPQYVPLWDRMIFRCLFFGADHQRKLVPTWLFPLLWPLVRHPNLLLPLAEAHGIYCFYNTAFVRGLAAMIAGKRCIEIGAGDGTLAGHLRNHGADLTAVDNHSWAGKIKIGRDVVKLDAELALRRFEPETVICAWPPAMNAFEEHIFAARSVRRYVVIGSGHKFSFGNRPVYRAQRSFTLSKSHDLSKHLLPPTFGGAVYVFDRVEQASPG